MNEQQEQKQETMVVTVDPATMLVEVLKLGCQVIGGVGAGIVVGTACSLVPLAAITGPLKLATGLGTLGIADAAGSIAGNQLAHRVDELSMMLPKVWNMGTQFGENLHKAMAQDQNQKN